MSANAIEIDCISKTFSGHKAVDDLSLSVPQGSVYGFIGPNGSGKTTTIRMIMKIYYPDIGSGEIRVLGEPHGGAVNERVGYLPEERGLYRKMKVKDLLRFYLELKGQKDHKKPIATWLERMGLSDWADKRIDTLSKGMAQKVQFISAVIHQPALVILDEPLSGLDPVNADVLREALLELRDGGTTVVFSTHDMGAAEQMCDFVFMIHEGRKVLDGTLDSIKDQYGADTLRVRVEGNQVDFKGLTDIEKVNDLGHLKELRMSNGARTQKVLEELMHYGRVTHFEVTRPSLHDIFVRIARPEAVENDHA